MANGLRTSGPFGRLVAKARAGAAAQRAREQAEEAKDIQTFRTQQLASLGPEFAQGLQAIQGGLAGAGPLADSGAAVALRRRLGSDIFGQATRGTADFLGDLIRQRRQFRYQSALQRQAEKAAEKNRKTGLGGFLGGVAGAVGGPFLGAVGEGVGRGLFD